MKKSQVARVNLCIWYVLVIEHYRGVVIERERTVRSVLNGPSVLFLSQPLWSEDILSERHGMRVISDAIAGM